VAVYPGSASSRNKIDNIASMQYIAFMQWALVYVPEFTEWLETQEEDLQDETLAHLGLLQERGPLLPRPYADTLKGSKLANLKELRFEYKGAPIRILFAFDPERQGAILLGGDKSSDKRWYDINIPMAENRYAIHLEREKKKDAEAREKKG
jgi:hypothetical protein